MSTPPVIDVTYLIAPTANSPFTHAKTWLQLIKGTRASDCPLPEHLIVTSIRHIKSRVRKQHERLLIHIHNPVGGRESWIISDRCYAQAASDQSTSSSLPSTPPANSISTSNSTIVSGISVDADDRVWFSIEGETSSMAYTRLIGTDDTLCQFNFEEKMSVAQLAFLFDAVHAHDCLYNLWETQCYWYANTVWRVIAEGWKGTVSHDELQEQRGKFKDKPIPMTESDPATLLADFKIRWAEWSRIRRESVEVRS